MTATTATAQRVEKQESEELTVKGLTNRQVKFLRMVVREMREAAAKHVTGELNFKALLRSGGVMDSYWSVESREA